MTKTNTFLTMTTAVRLTDTSHLNERVLNQTRARYSLSLYYYQFITLRICADTSAKGLSATRSATACFRL